MRLLPIPSFLTSILLINILAACGGNNTASNVNPPGEEKSAKTQTLETGTALLQNKAPLDAINVYMDGFHFHNGNMNRQMEAHHYCTLVNEDLTQCTIYEGNGKNARLMGVEYIVSEKIFKTLPAEEKKLWHSHVFEVKSGQLIAPGVPDAAEHEFMEKVASTYGKTWHTWHTEQTNMNLPLGHPALMMGFTADGQIKPALVQDRDKRFNISTEDKKQNRADIPKPQIQAGADAWQKGQTVQLKLEPVSGANKTKP